MTAASDLVRVTVFEALSECTEAQQKLFGRLYPGGPTDGQLEVALDQILRTIAKNGSKS